MKNVSLFQIGVYVACVIGIIAGVFLFARSSGKSTDKITGSVTIWGTLPFSSFTATNEVVRALYKDVSVSYIEKDSASFQNELVNALASGVGPDMIFTSPEFIIPNKDRLLTIPFTSLPEQTFRGAFVDHAELYINDQGVVAFPFIIDPLVMYYNRDMLNSAFITQPPKTWDDLIAINKKITQKDDAGNLQVQTTALGTYDNITRAKELLVMLINQAGNRLVRFDGEQKKYVSTFADSNQQVSPVANAVGFYTAFSNASDVDRYSWNRTLPTDKNQFLAGKLAVYFGLASELESIRLRNPNLNFAMDMMPQRSSVPTKVTYGTMTGLAVLKNSPNANLAVMIGQVLVGKDSVTAFLANSPYLAPARRDMLGASPVDANQAIVYQSAIISRGFLDPDASQTNTLFKRTIDQINAGLAGPDSIITSGNSLFTTILNNVQK